MSKPLVRDARLESSLDLPVDPPRAGESKQAWVYRQIRERILRGVLPSGGRLPSTRDLAARWHVARSTVEAAYDQLRGEGYTAGTVGSGTYVAAVIPDNFFRRGLPGEGDAVPEATAAQARRRAPASAPDTVAPAGSADPSAPSPRREASFMARSADASLFPMETWRKGLMASAQRVTPAQLAHEDPLGWHPLREQIARYLGAARGINYKTQDFVKEVKDATGGRGVDVILDMVAGDYIGRDMQCLADDGRIVIIAQLGGAQANVDTSQVMRRRLTITGSTLRPRPVDFKGAIARALREHAWPLLEQGAIKPIVHATFPLAQAAQAHAMMESGENIGKIILTV